MGKSAERMKSHTPDQNPLPAALDALSMSANGQYLVTLGEAIQRGAGDFAKHQGRLRGSMDTVAKMLRESADQWKRTAETVRYDEPRGVRHALDVHINLLRDLAAELDRPGETKYAPNVRMSDGGLNASD